MKQKLRFLMLTLLCAVFSTTWGQTTLTYTFTITPNDFPGNGYTANNGEHTSTAICTTDATKTISVTWASADVMKSSTQIQFKKSTGRIYNITKLNDLNDGNGLDVNPGTSGAFTIYYGGSEQPGATTTDRYYFKLINSSTSAARRP